MAINNNFNKISIILSIAICCLRNIFTVVVVVVVAIAAAVVTVFTY